MSSVRTIPVTTHGRYLVDRPELPGGAPLLVGFHGYAEAADDTLARLRQIPNLDAWRLAAIQGLSRFYNRRSQDVIASWMTRQDRDLVITDNLAYVDAVLERLHAEFGSSSRIVYAGFSQGVAMAFRAACLGAAAVREVIAMGGDVPPDLAPEQLRRLQRVLIGRGLKDDWYSAAKFDEDQRRLREARIDVTPAALDIGHEWTGEFSRAAGEFVRGQP